MNTVPERLTAALADRYRIERELGAGGIEPTLIDIRESHGPRDKTSQWCRTALQRTACYRRGECRGFLKGLSWTKPTANTP